MPKIGYLSSAGETFLLPILRELSKQYDIENLIQPDEEGNAILNWPPKCDLVWIEWANELAVSISKQQKACPTIVRLHSYEVFTDYPKMINWSNVDCLIFVAEHVKEYALNHFIIEGPRIEVIPNGMDLERFSPRRCRESRKKIAWVGGITAKKGPMLFLQACHALHRWDEQFTFHVAGEFQDKRFKQYFNSMIPKLGLEHCITFYGKIPYREMPAWYSDKEYILSTSPWESFQYAVAEGIISGCIPLVHGWEGSAEIYPNLRTWNTIAELAEVIEELQEDERGFELLKNNLRTKSLDKILPMITQCVGDLIKC